ncbi:MAG: hypothetical protein MI741_01995 [Rhodospirillales bacterium]|nr:hypothetical protein [Rhodospirillales bacterium]
MNNTNPWDAFTTGELESKLNTLRELAEDGSLSARSMERELAEIGIIERELARRNDK